ncbi:hypothetical protein VTI74DRAFT_6590 [Chaetomium olivicolor]
MVTGAVVDSTLAVPIDTDNATPGVANILLAEVNQIRHFLCEEGVDDSDFTLLAARIRESGLVMHGFGKRKTTKPFVVACDGFIYSGNLRVTPHADDHLPMPL